MIAEGLVVFLTLFGAILAVTQRNIVRALFGLGVALAGVALAFLLLNSPFVAAMQVLIYIGGITVALAFGVMLSSTGRAEPPARAGRRLLAGVAATAFFVALATVVWTTDFGAPAAIAGRDWSVEHVGTLLLDRYNVVFELLSVVLLVAIVGAITIASRHDSPDPTSSEEDEA